MGNVEVTDTELIQLIGALYIRNQKLAEENVRLRAELDQLKEVFEISTNLSENVTRIGERSVESVNG